jgi:rhamnopyranosyl-N-acetylglucosaminyl-diphospho-decaprenol beta-1,3/1,4-galactofuranosyltransferase
MPAPLKIAALLATRNRRETLEKGLRAVVNQTRAPDHVFVVDNASTDGTAPWLERWRKEDELRRSWAEHPRNLGGAGGIQAALVRALAEGFDAFWWLDDDSLPAPDCLDKLEAALKLRSGLVAPLLLQKGNAQNLACSFYDVSRRGFITTVGQVVQPFYEGLALSAQGSLFDRATVTRIGLPKAEFFSWGHEIEYVLRAFRKDTPLCTAARARHEVTLPVSKLELADQEPRTPEQFTAFCHYRNSAYLSWNYEGPAACSRWLIKETLAASVRGKLRRAKLIATAGLKGARADFSIEN